jgi:hypothetical protein
MKDAGQLAGDETEAGDPEPERDPRAVFLEGLRPIWGWRGRDDGRENRRGDRDWERWIRLRSAHRGTSPFVGVFTILRRLIRCFGGMA